MHQVNPHLAPLTKEERDELKKLWEDYNRLSSNSSYGLYGNSDWMYDYDDPPEPNRRKHDWYVDTYFTSKKFYTCKYCQAKKEDPNIGDYCEESETEF